eukprot:1340707-Pyramimonas_sp.AAC.1
MALLGAVPLISTAEVRVVVLLPKALVMSALLVPRPLLKVADVMAGVVIVVVLLELKLAKTTLLLLARVALPSNPL